MAALTGLNRFINLLRAPCVLFFAGRIWWPLACFAALSGLALYAFSNYATSLSYTPLRLYLSFMNTLMAGLGVAPDTLRGFSHYPQLYYLLPTQFEWGRALLGALAEGFAMGLAARAFYRRYETSRRRALAPLGVSVWVRCLTLWLLVYVLLSVATYLIPGIFQSWLSGSPRRMMGLEFALFCFNMALLAPTACAIPLVAIGGESVGRALRLSLALFRRHPILIYSLVFFPSLLLVYPLNVAISPASGLIGRLQPEISVYLLAFLIVANAIVNFLYVGSITRLLVEEAPAH